MKGFLLGALILAGLDVLLQAPASRLPGLFTPLTAAVSKWLDPTVPLIPARASSASQAGSTPGTGTSSPKGKAPPGEVRQVAGKCPPGYLADDQHPGFCIQVLT